MWSLLYFYAKYTYTQGEFGVVTGEHLGPALLPFIMLVPLDDHCSTTSDVDPPDDQATTGSSLSAYMDHFPGEP